MKPRFYIFFENLAASLMSVVKILILTTFNLPKPPFSFPDKPCVLLGNGPSLKDFLHKHLSFLENKELMCVNLFVRTEEFTALKPRFYILIAPDFWTKEEKPGWREERYKLFDALVEKTQWDLYLFVPAIARKSKDWKAIISQNKYIKVFYVNNTPVEGFTAVNHFFFKRWWGMPRPHNVLVAGLFIALNLKFSDIYMAGADHSWIKELVVSNDNRVFLSQKHFYDHQLSQSDNKAYTPEAKPMYVGTTSRERKLHEILHKFYYSFRSYWELKEYANALNIRVYNMTEGSYIDAFERYYI